MIKIITNRIKPSKAFNGVVSKTFNVETGSYDNLYVPLKDVPYLIAKLQDALYEIKKEQCGQPSTVDKTGGTPAGKDK